MQAASSAAGTASTSRGSPAAGATATRPPMASVGVIPSLDGLRAFSVMVVFLAHSGLEHIVPGGFGVTVFFFLSGFLITTLMRAEHARNGHVNLGHFWLRRALRILPPFYLVLLLAIGLHALVFDWRTLSLAGMLAQALFGANYWIIYNGSDGIAAGSGVYWSLAVEEHFYLLFPWLFIALQRARVPGRTQAQLLWALAAAVLAWRCVLVYGFGVPDDRTYMASDTRVDSILFGCALAVWHNPVLDREAPDERRWKWLWMPLALALLLSTFLIRDPGLRATLRYTAQGVALTAVFYAAIHFPHWLPFRLLNWKPVAFLGVLSYSLYLVHQAILYAWLALVPGQPWIVNAGVVFAISLGVAYAIFRLVEKPCARLRRRLMD